jgi:hypothetical protein
MQLTGAQYKFDQGKAPRDAQRRRSVSAPPPFWAATACRGPEWRYCIHRAGPFTYQELAAWSGWAKPPNWWCMAYSQNHSEGARTRHTTAWMEKREQGRLGFDHACELWRARYKERTWVGWSFIGMFTLGTWGGIHTGDQHAHSVCNSPSSHSTSSHSTCKISYYSRRCTVAPTSRLGMFLPRCEWNPEVRGRWRHLVRLQQDGLGRGPGATHPTDFRHGIYMVTGTKKHSEISGANLKLTASMRQPRCGHEPLKGAAACYVLRAQGALGRCT